jgi:hypothetical protein
LFARRQRQDPVPIYLILAAGQAVCFSLFFTIQLVYQVTFIGLNPLQMMLVGTVLEVTCFVFEVPTGIVADVYSRRLSILIGVVLMGCSYTLEGGIPHFWAALVSQVFWGIGYTFTSGANQAWISDEIGEEAAGPIFLRAGQMGLIGGLAGTVLCMVLGVINIQLPMVLAGVGMFVLAGTMTLVMPERRMRPTPPAERSTFGHMQATAQEGIQIAMARPVARTIIVISLFVGLAAEAMDRLSVFRDTQEFPEPLRTQAQEGLRAYVDEVMDSEWRSWVINGEVEPHTSPDPLNPVWAVYRQMQPETAVEATDFEHATERLHELERQRHLRHLASEATLPPLFMPVLVVGGVLTIGFSYFLRLESTWAQAAMTAVVAVLIAGSLFLIFSLNHPFTGLVQVDKEPFRHALQQFNALNLS